MLFYHPLAGLALPSSDLILIDPIVTSTTYSTKDAGEECCWTPILPRARLRAKHSVTVGASMWGPGECLDCVDRCELTLTINFHQYDLQLASINCVHDSRLTYFYYQLFGCSTLSYTRCRKSMNCNGPVKKLEAPRIPLHHIPRRHHHEPPTIRIS